MLELDVISGVVTFNIDKKLNLKCCILNSPGEDCKTVDNNEYMIAVRHARQTDGTDEWYLIINDDTKAKEVFYDK